MVLDEKIKWDKIQCDAWKEEVQNLLIFVRLLIFENTFSLRLNVLGWSVLRSRNGVHREYL